MVWVAPQQANPARRPEDKQPLSSRAHEPVIKIGHLDCSLRLAATGVDRGGDIQRSITSYYYATPYMLLAVIRQVRQ